jgi:hypothetical protein
LVGIEVILEAPEASGANLSTRNRTNLSTLKLLRWNNWFYAGTASFLQSSVQEINLQTTLGGGII